MTQMKRRKRYMCSVCFGDIMQYPALVMDTAAAATLVCDECAHERDHQTYVEKTCKFCQKIAKNEKRRLPFSAKVALDDPRHTNWEKMVWEEVTLEPTGLIVDGAHLYRFYRNSTIRYYAQPFQTRHHGTIMMEVSYGCPLE